jgi:hypothetical protein
MFRRRREPRPVFCVVSAHASVGSLSVWTKIERILLWYRFTHQPSLHHSPRERVSASVAAVVTEKMHQTRKTVPAVVNVSTASSSAHPCLLAALERGEEARWDDPPVLIRQR